MKTGIFSLISPISDPEFINGSLLDYTKAISNEFDIVYLDKLSNENDCDMVFVFVKTGGTEEKFKKSYPYLPSPVLLVSTPLHNSLAASMEILSWIQSNGGIGRILHGPPEKIVFEMRQWLNVEYAKKRIKEGELGVIGAPSDWLIDSGVDIQTIENNWGLKIHGIDIRSLIDSAESVAAEKAAETIAQKDSSAGKTSISDDDLSQTAKVYCAMKDIIEVNGLSAITLRCFDLLDTIKTTGCLALSWLNNEGIIAGCEGDIPSVFTMMVAYYLTGEYPFMANLYTINTETNELLFAHCTVPTRNLDSYTYNTHFESGIGVGIKGEFPHQKATIVKIGGKNLTEYVIKTGKIIENKNSPFACRTQILVRLDGDSSYFLNNPIANHHIILLGDHSAILEKLFSSVAVQMYKRH